MCNEQKVVMDLEPSQLRLLSLVKKHIRDSEPSIGYFNDDNIPPELNERLS